MPTSLRSAWLVALALLASSAALAAKRPTVVVAPFTSTSSEEYQWIGGALGEALTSRLLASGEANVFSQRQWAAVLRERDIAARDVRTDDDIKAVGRQLGADQVIVGTFTATWPDVRVQARRVAIDGSSLARGEVSGHLEDLPKLEAELARKLLAPAFRKAARGRAAPRSVYAWRELSLCRAPLALQSIGPRAQPWLPAPLVKEAVAHCEQAEKLDRKLVEAKSFHGLGLLLLGQPREARSFVEAALRARKSPGWPDLVAYFVRARAGDVEKGEQALRRAAKARPGFLHARTTLGESLLERGALDEAKQAFEASLKDAPNQPWALIQLGKVLAKKGDVDGALATTDKALALVPGDAVLLLEKASRQIDGKRYKEAEATLREAMKQDPRLAATYLRLGYVYLETDQLDLARPILEKAVFEADLQSEQRVKGYAHFDLAKLAARQKDTKAALARIQKAIAAGFHDRSRFEADADLQEVVKDPAFAAMFERPAGAADQTSAPPAD